MNPNVGSRRRLTEPFAIGPIRKAENFTRCELYWLPASLPSKTWERTWTLHFLSELFTRLAGSGRFQTEVFLESETIYPDLRDEFIQSSLDFNPVMGLADDEMAPSHPCLTKITLRPFDGRKGPMTSRTFCVAPAIGFCAISGRDSWTCFGDSAV